MHHPLETSYDSVVDELLVTMLSRFHRPNLKCKASHLHLVTSNYLCKWVSIRDKWVINISGYYVYKYVGKTLDG